MSEEFQVSKTGVQRIVHQMLIFAQGIASISINSGEDFTQEKIGYSLSEMFIALLLGCKVRENTLDLEFVKGMYEHMGDLPQKKNDVS